MKKKITIISLDQWGFDNYIVDHLKTKENLIVNHINFYKFIYSYPSFFHKIFNFLAKNIFNYNIKKAHLNREIIKRLKELPKQDKILMIKADHLLPQKIAEIKNYTNEFIVYFSDSVHKCPKIKKIHHLYDKVFSFEKDDVSSYGFEFITNYIYKENVSKPNKIEYSVFNISAYDKRIQIIEKFAKKLDIIAPNYKIINVGKRKDNLSTSSNIIFSKERMELDKVDAYIKKSLALLDVTRSGQKGLTFRVFESLGCQKKLITTNKDIVNYDFYNPNNILVIDENKVKIPKEFFETPYQEVPKDIYNTYCLEHWTKTVLNI